MISRGRRRLRPLRRGRVEAIGVFPSTSLQVRYSRPERRNWLGEGANFASFFFIPHFPRLKFFSFSPMKATAEKKNAQKMSRKTCCHAPPFPPIIVVVLRGKKGSAPKPALLANRYFSHFCSSSSYSVSSLSSSSLDFDLMPPLPLPFYCVSCTHYRSLSLPSPRYTPEMQNFFPSPPLSWRGKKLPFLILRWVCPPALTTAYRMGWEKLYSALFLLFNARMVRKAL